MNPIPFSRPSLAGHEMDYIAQVIQNEKLSGDGPFTKKAQSYLEENLQSAKALLTTSGTHALEMAALLCDVQEGDEVIVPSFTFVSSINAFILRGAKPVFIDVRPDTLNLDEKLLPSLITTKTKAVVPVHYSGVACEMDPIMELSKKHGFFVVEDAAHAVFGKYKGRALGSIGHFGALSFHDTKNIICGEGGAILLNDKSYVTRAEILREKGTNRSQFFRGEVDKYTWTDLGSSYVPSELLAAFLMAQLEEHEKIQTRRRILWGKYYQELAIWAADNSITMQTIPNHCQQTWHLFYMLMPNLESRTRLMQYLKDKKIQTTFHYVPLHTSPMGQKFGGHQGQTPVAEDVADRLIRLPLYHGLTDQEQDYIIRSCLEFKI